MRPGVGAILTLLLVTPVAAAGVPFAMTLEDDAEDVVAKDGKAVSSPTADILRFESRVENGSVVQRIEMAARPIAPDDSILVRNWYANSTNGSFHVIDMEVRGSEPDPAKRFLPLQREGDFFNVTYLDAKWGIDGNAWVFTFSAALVESASCFDPGVFTDHQPPTRARQRAASDKAYSTTVRSCATAVEPAPPMPRLPVVAPVVGAPQSTIQEDAPGSRTPTPGPGFVLLLLAAGGAFAFLRARRPP